MKKYILLTESESGDNYHYFIECNFEPTTSELIPFLFENAIDKDNNEVYEHIVELIEVKNELFIKI